MPRPERFFDLSPQGPSWGIFYFWATLCRLCYHSRADWKSQAAQVAGPGVVSHLGPPAPQFPAVDLYAWDGCLGIVIQGTAGYQQYLLQAFGATQSSISPWPGRISFFWSAIATGLLSLVRPALDTYQPRQVLVAGHSYGGAVAQLLGYALRQELGLDFRGAVTIGAPRVGNPAFCSGQTWPHWRIVNQGDPVPYLPPGDNFCLQTWPPSGLFASYSGYQHFGLGFLLSPDGAAVGGQLAETAVEVFGNPYLLVGNASGWVNSHHSGEYGRRLRLQLPQLLREPGVLSELFGRLDNLQLSMNAADGRTW